MPSGIESALNNVKKETITIPSPTIRSRPAISRIIARKAIIAQIGTMFANTRTGSDNGLHRPNERDSVIDCLSDASGAGAGVSAEHASEDSGRDGGGSWVGLGTLTGRLQWGHSILARALLSSTEMVWMHQGQSKWIAITSIQSHCTVRRKACRNR